MTLDIFNFSQAFEISWIKINVLLNPLTPCESKSYFNTSISNFHLVKGRGRRRFSFGSDMDQMEMDIVDGIEDIASLEEKKAKLEEVTASMVELTERQRRWTIKASKVEEEWNETLEERRKMRIEMGDLILNLHTVDSKFGIQVF